MKCRESTEGDREFGTKEGTQPQGKGPGHRTGVSGPHHHPRGHHRGTVASRPALPMRWASKPLTHKIMFLWWQASCAPQGSIQGRNNRPNEVAVAWTGRGARDSLTLFIPFAPSRMKQVNSVQILETLGKLWRISD